jgi:hypothetical protein
MSCLIVLLHRTRRGCVLAVKTFNFVFFVSALWRWGTYSRWEDMGHNSL